MRARSAWLQCLPRRIEPSHGYTPPPEKSSNRISSTSSESQDRWSWTDFRISFMWTRCGNALPWYTPSPHLIGMGGEWNAWRPSPGMTPLLRPCDLHLQPRYLRCPCHHGGLPRIRYTCGDTEGERGRRHIGTPGAPRTGFRPPYIHPLAMACVFVKLACNCVLSGIKDNIVDAIGPCHFALGCKGGCESLQ